MSAAAVKRIAKALRSEAAIADRPGQMERLNTLAEQVEALAPKPPKPPRPKVLYRAAVRDPKQIGHPWVTCVKVGDHVTSTYQTHGAIWEVLEAQEAFNSDRYGPLLRLPYGDDFFEVAPCAVDKATPLHKCFGRWYCTDPNCVGDR